MPRPSLEEFLAAARSEFSFLVSEWGFHEVVQQLRNPFTVVYERGTDSITVEGINWGNGALVTIRVRHDGSPLLVPLWMLAGYRRPDRVPALVPGQIAQLVQLAKLLRDCGPHSLERDLSYAKRWMDAAARAAWWNDQQQMEQHQLVTPALEAFRKKDYETAAQLLSAVTTGLRGSEKAKLDYARRKVRIDA